MDAMKTDRTRELELRLRAIRVSQGDTCAFFKRRDGCVMGFKHCAYCRFGVFEKDNGQGFCKYKISGGTFNIE